MHAHACKFPVIYRIKESVIEFNEQPYKTNSISIMFWCCCLRNFLFARNTLNYFSKSQVCFLFVRHSSHDQASKLSRFKDRYRRHPELQILIFVKNRQSMYKSFWKSFTRTRFRIKSPNLPGLTVRYLRHLQNAKSIFSKNPQTRLKSF